MDGFLQYLAKCFAAATLAVATAFAIAITIVVAAGGWNGWGSVSHTSTTHFASKWASSSKVQARCGLPTSKEFSGKDGYSQRFQSCWMSEGAVQIHSYGSPATSTPVPTATATYAPLPTVPPTTTPWPTAMPLPTNTQVPQTLSSQMVAVINETRASYGVPPLTESTAQDACSEVHSEHMYQQHGISHDEFPQDVCIGWNNVGENVGQAGPGDPLQMLGLLHSEMMNEPHSVGCQGNHACNIISPLYNRVGVGVYVAPDGTVWLTEDFAG